MATAEDGTRPSLDVADVTGHGCELRWEVKRGDGGCLGDDMRGLVDCEMGRFGCEFCFRLWS
jgi:hypothetical protein